MDFAISVTTVVVDVFVHRCFRCFALRSGYVCNLKDNLEDLQQATRELQAVNADMMRRLQLEEDGQLKRSAVFLMWQKRAEETILEASTVIQYYERNFHSRCLGGCCSKNCLSSYQFGRRVQRILEDVDALLLSRVDIQAQNEESIVRGVEKPIEPTVIEELKPMMEKVSRGLMDEQVGTIGICGMAGVGKTTLLKLINNEHATGNAFHVVIWITDLRIERVQEVIGERISLYDQEWKSKTIDDKAIDIFSVLRKKKFLLLLDDMWEPLDLVSVGVPLPKRNKNGSKIVFTTRREDVCRKMDAQISIKMEPLQWKYSWALFERHVGKEILDSSPEIRRSAEAIVRECHGLPLKLITVAREMASKRSPEEWQHVARYLGRSTSKLSSTMETVEEEYPVQDVEAGPSTSSNLQGLKNSENAEVKSLIDLKQRYDSLANNTVRFCFLYCTLFPPDLRILKDDLIHYWICEKFGDDYCDSVGTYNEGYYIIDILVRSRLLEDQGKYIKIRRVIRDLGLQIARDCEGEEEIFLVEAGAQLIEAPETGKWERVRRMSLMENSIQILENEPRCPHLLSLFLCRNPSLVMIIPDFFLSMKALTVLDLSMTGIQELPQQISSLLSLQYLNLSHTMIQRLPVELGKLEKLKYLNLDHTVFLSVFPRKVISQLLLLQVLRMFRCGCVNEEMEAKEREKGHVEELQGLEHLNVLSITIRCASAFRPLFSTRRFRRCTQALFLEHLIDSESILDKHLNEELNFDAAMLRVRSFISLEQVRVEKCFYLQDLTWLVLAPNLKILSVAACGKLEEIISAAKLGEIHNVDKSLNPFAKLEVLELQNLSQMKTIYWDALEFPFLETIEVFNCPQLKKLPLDCNSAKGCRLVIKAEEHWWNDVEWMDDNAQIAFMHCFQGF